MAVIVKLATALLPIFLLKEHCPAVASHKQSVSDYEEIIQDYLLKISNQKLDIWEPD
jgi:hypothetical protein